MLRWISLLIGRNRPDDQAVALYQRVVTQARQPVFYRDYAVPDTLDGRFEMIVLHAILVMRRLRQAGEAGRLLSQSLFDLLFADMDSSLREIGVGDLSVGKKIKAMGQAFYGRVEAYESGLQTAADAPLAAALTRNLYGTTEPPAAAVAAMAAYIRRADALLAAQPDGNLLAGNPDFLVPSGL